MSAPAGRNPAAAPFQWQRATCPAPAVPAAGPRGPDRACGAHPSPPPSVEGARRPRQPDPAPRRPSLPPPELRRRARARRPRSPHPAASGAPRRHRFSVAPCHPAAPEELHAASSPANSASPCRLHPAVPELRQLHHLRPPSSSTLARIRPPRFPRRANPRSGGSNFG